MMDIENSQPIFVLTVVDTPRLWVSVEGKR